MATDVLIQGKTYPWKVNDKGEALVTTEGDATNDYVTDYEIDSVDDTFSYVGKRLAGVASSAAEWQVVRLESLANGSVRATSADGDLAFDNIWDNRESLSYS